jgi:hypothetical protein
MAVSSWRRRKDVICDKGAVASAFVYLCRNLGSLRLKRAIRDCEVCGPGASLAYRLANGLHCGNGWMGGWRARRSVRRNIFGRGVLREKGLMFGPYVSYVGAQPFIGFFESGKRASTWLFSKPRVGVQMMS